MRCGLRSCILVSHVPLSNLEDLCALTGVKYVGICHTDEYTRSGKDSEVSSMMFPSRLTDVIDVRWVETGCISRDFGPRRWWNCGFGPTWSNFSLTPAAGRVRWRRGHKRSTRTPPFHRRSFHLGAPVLVLRENSIVRVIMSSLYTLLSAENASSAKAAKPTSVVRVCASSI